MQVDAYHKQYFDYVMTGSRHWQTLRALQYLCIVLYCIGPDTE